MALSTVHSHPSILYVSTQQYDPSSSETFDAEPAFKRIGRLFNTALTEMQEGEINEQTPIFFSALKKLGVERDEPAAQFALKVLRSVPNLRARPNNAGMDISGVYYLYNPAKTEAPAEKSTTSKSSSCKVSTQKLPTTDVENVFKVGGPRLDLERLSAKLAHWTGLQDHVTCVLPFVLQNADLDPNIKENSSGMLEQLLNGNEKEYQEIPKQMVGGVQPFLPKDDQAVHSIEDFTKMLMFALISGLRDGKEDGMVSSHLHNVLYDGDDSFAMDIEPPLGMTLENFKNKAIAATDLPLLKHANTAKELTEDEISNLAVLVSSWNIEEIGSRLAAEPILYFDRKAEKAAEGKKLKDETGTRFISCEGAPHLINGERTFVDINDREGQKTILNSQQVVACKERMKRVKAFILQMHNDKKLFKPLDLVMAMDPFFKIYVDALTTIPERDPTMTLEKALGRFSIFEVVGRRFPQVLGTREFGLNADALTGVTNYMFGRYQNLPRLTSNVETDGAQVRGSNTLEFKAPSAEKKSPTKMKKPPSPTKVRVHLRELSPSVSLLD